MLPIFRKKPLSPYFTPILGHCCVEYSTCAPASPVADDAYDPSFAFDSFKDMPDIAKAKSGADCTMATTDYIEISGMYYLYVCRLFWGKN